MESKGDYYTSEWARVLESYFESVDEVKKVIITFGVLHSPNFIYWDDTVFFLTSEHCLIR